MKKLLSFLFAWIILFSVASADVDLSSISYNELIALQRSITAEIMSRPEWKEVKVPAGQWKVGEDIPAGTYCLKALESSVLIVIWRYEIDNYSNDGLVFNEVIRGGEQYGKLTLQDGWIVVIDDPILFTPPVSLGF